jgi:uncharacterized MAPEG superfamily protein
MPSEIRILAWTLVLAIVQIFAASISRTRDYGVEWNMGARDVAVPPPSPVAGRLARAQQNLFETLPLFAAAVLAAAVTNQLGPQTLLGAHLYFWGRLLYLPVYALGIKVVRSIIWGVSFAGLVLILIELLF